MKAPEVGRIPAANDAVPRAALGSEISALFRDEHYRHGVLPRAVALDGPKSAVGRICAAYGLHESFLFSAVPKFAQVSQFARDNDLHLLIQAPHSHWPGSSAVVYRYLPDSNRYLVGQPALEPGRVYFPVSFVQWDGVIYPYEWVDESVDFAADFWGRHFVGVAQAFSKLISNADPVGIGIDFRFRHGRNAGARKSPSTVEFPVDAVAGLDSHGDFSLIVTDDDFLSLSVPRRETVVVAWPCRSDADLPLSADGLAALCLVRAALNDLSDMGQREAYLQQVERQLGLDASR